ncbi:MAG: hypothetical protein AB1515_05115 [Nitrospirota bacterium]
MLTEIGEVIKVGAVFDPEQGEGHGIIPKWFIWQGRRFTVDRITFSWKVRDGRMIFHHFAVINGATLYELTYNAAMLDWKLMNISSV